MCLHTHQCETFPSVQTYACLCIKCLHARLCVSRVNIAHLFQSNVCIHICVRLSLVSRHTHVCVSCVYVRICVYPVSTLRISFNHKSPYTSVWSVLSSVLTHNKKKYMSAYFSVFQAHCARMRLEQCLYVHVASLQWKKSGRHWEIQKVRAATRAHARQRTKKLFGIYIHICVSLDVCRHMGICIYMCIYKNI